MTTPSVKPMGGVTQSSLRQGPKSGQARGLLTRGVVVATYVYDDPAHPAAGATPSAIYCDVMAYGMRPGQRYVLLPQCLVLQPTGGMQRGRIWRPKAASRRISDAAAAASAQTSTPGDLDGDHVLVGFLDDHLSQPIILGGVPHPSSDTGHQASDPVGYRMRLTLADGDPDFAKHHGAYYGLDASGSYQVDLRQSNDGSLQQSGAESAPVAGTTGHHEARLQATSHHTVGFYDTSGNLTQEHRLDGTKQLTTFAQPGSSPVMWAIVAGASGSTVNALSLSNHGPNAVLQLGDGSVHVAIAEHVQQLYASLVTWLNAHTHPTATGPSGPASALPPTVPQWMSTIQSGHFSLPDG